MHLALSYKPSLPEAWEPPRIEYSGGSLRVRWASTMRTSAQLLRLCTIIHITADVTRHLASMGHRSCRCLLNKLALLFLLSATAWILQYHPSTRGAESVLTYQGCRTWCSSSEPLSLSLDTTVGFLALTTTVLLHQWFSSVTIGRRRWQTVRNTSLALCVASY